MVWVDNTTIQQTNKLGILSSNFLLRFSAEHFINAYKSDICSLQTY